MKPPKSKPPEPPPWWRRRPTLAAAAVFLLAVLVFYWTPLTDPNTTPQWDTIDQHYSIQKFIGEEFRSFRLPHWTDYAYTGFPTLADPQAAAWYPLNWPFFAAGVTPKGLQMEIALHVFLACLGAWLLARLWLGDPLTSAAAALCYGFSGFFAGHASHLGMIQTAAWFPLLLYGIHRSIRTSQWRTMLWTGVAGACMFLAGHSQTALYSFAAAAIYALVVAALEKRWVSAITVLAVCAALTVLLSAIQWLPTAELAGQSIRADMSFRSQTNSPLEPRALLTLALPNYYGSVKGPYSGPTDRTQFYFYGGFLLVPLAILALSRNSGVRWVALALALPFAWYALGPAAGLYQAVTLLPGFSSVRAPVHAWFVIALALALLASAGLGVVASRVKARWVPAAVLAFLFADTMYWNSAVNELAYGRVSFEDSYGKAQDVFNNGVRRVLPEGMRFHAPEPSMAFGPLGSAYDLRLPVTYGYNPLPLRRYVEYMEMAASNPRLLNGLYVGASVDMQTGHLAQTTNALPQFYFPRSVRSGSGKAALANLNPLDETVVEGSLDGIRQEPSASLRVTQASQERYGIHTSAGTPSLVHSSIPWFPAWRVTVDGAPVPVRIADHAMLAFVVPAGQHEVVVQYHPDRFRTGAIVSLLAVMAVTALLAWDARRAHRS